MAKVEIVLNPAGVRELLKSDDIMQICKEHANRAVSALGDGYAVNTYVGANRVNAEVSAETFAARRDNMKNNTILKALGGG